MPGVRVEAGSGGRAHPRSAGSRCFGVWSPALPPSARTGSGLSGTARTLQGHTVERGAPRYPAPAASRRGARRQPYLAAPASDSWRPQLSARHKLQDDPVSPLGLRRQTVLSVYPRLPGNRPEPERNSLTATVSPGRDVTGSGSRAREDDRPRGNPACRSALNVPNAPSRCLSPALSSVAVLLVRTSARRAGSLQTDPRPA